MSLVMIFVCVLAIGMMITIVYHVVERPNKAATAPKGLDELIKQLDKTIDSVRTKTKIDSLSFAVTNEAEAQEKEKISLSGILWSKKGSLAIINKKVVGMGDRVADCWVSEIKEDNVALRCKDGEEKVIRCY